MITNNELVKTLDFMPRVFSSNAFAQVLRNKYVVGDFIESGRMNVFLAEHCYAINGTKRMWRRKVDTSKPVYTPRDPSSRINDADTAYVKLKNFVSAVIEVNDDVIRITLL